MPPQQGLLVRMLRYLLPVWPLAVLSIALTVVVSVLGQVPQLVNRYLIDHVLAAPHPGADAVRLLLRVALALFGLRLVGAALGFGRSYILRVLGQRLTYAMRRDVHRQLHELSVDFHLRQGVGQLMSRVMTDTQTVQSFLTGNITGIMTQIFSFVSALVILTHYDPALTWALLLFGPPLALCLWIFAGRLRPLNRLIRAQVARLNGVLHDSLAGFVTIKALAAEGPVLERFEADNLRLFGMQVDLMKVQAAFSNSMGLVTGASGAFFLLFGGSQVLRHSITLGTYFLVNGLRGNLFIPFNSFAGITTQYQRAAAGAERIFAVLDTAPAVRDAPGALPLEHPRGGVRFEDVVFRYPAEDVSAEAALGAVPPPSLQGVSFDLEPGQTVGLVGPSGGGKSTVAALLLRLYDCDAGRVLLDGRDVRDLTLTSLRQAVTAVLQQVYLFSATVRENVAFGCPEATPEGVDAVLRACQADFVWDLPHGPDTQLGEGGHLLSGGQRQRLAIARALLRRPRVLILDEATSAQDTLGEQALMHALRTLEQPMTVLLIAHRLTTVTQADRILVLERGMLAEQGTHGELLRRGGLYARLWGAQGGGPGAEGAPSAW